MPELLRHAASKNVKLWLWARWTDISQQMDEVFPLFEKWGVAGVKIDFMDRDDQWMVDFYRRVVKKAAEHHLMIDFRRLERWVTAAAQPTIPTGYWCRIPQSQAPAESTGP